MRRIQYNLRLMGILIAVSAISVLIIEVEWFRAVKEFIRMLFPFLSGRGVLISNLFLGIGASALVAFAAAAIDLWQERKNVSASLLDAYKLLKKEILPHLGKETVRQTGAHYEYDGAMSRCKRAAEENSYLLKRHKSRQDADYYIVRLIYALDAYYQSIRILALQFQMECGYIDMYDKLIASDLRWLRDMEQDYSSNIQEWSTLGFPGDVYKEYMENHRKNVQSYEEGIRKSRDRRKECRKKGVELIGKMREVIRRMETDEEIEQCRRYLLMYTGI